MHRLTRVLKNDTLCVNQSNKEIETVSYEHLGTVLAVVSMILLLFPPDLGDIFANDIRDEVLKKYGMMF